MQQPNVDEKYLGLVQDIFDYGTDKGDRTGTGTISLFGAQLRFDLSKGFPLLTTKKLYTRAIFHELLWMLKGDTNIKYLVDNNVHIWDEWADEQGELGPVYGHQWVNYKGSVEMTLGTEKNAEGYLPYKKVAHSGFNQIQNVIDRIKSNPNCRRLIVSAWTVDEIETMALPPCHCFFQFWVADGKLSCQLYQRSADIGLGVPFNIASYALLTHMVAHVCDLEVGDFVHTFGDVHIYKNHVDQMKEQLSRDTTTYELPTLKLNPEVKDIFDFTYEDIELLNYQSHPNIKMDVSV